MRGLLFKPPMALANLAGTKTVTRRMRGLERVNAGPESWDMEYEPRVHTEGGWFEPGRFGTLFRLRAPGKPRFQNCAPYVSPGQVFYQKETYRRGEDTGGTLVLHFRADPDEPAAPGQWKSPLMMKATDARFYALCTSVRCERIQDITEEGALAEGFVAGLITGQPAREMFLEGFFRINRLAPDINWWVWVIAYERISSVEAWR